LNRVRVVLVALAIALTVGVGLILERGLEGVRAAEALQHEIVAERVFDELEGELSAFISREEARPFLHWRFLYLPEGQAGANAYVRSPLSTPPAEPWIVGYFQLDPDGSFSTPLVPRNPSLAESTGWTETSTANELAERLERLTEVVARPDPLPDRLASKTVSAKPLQESAPPETSAATEALAGVQQKVATYKGAILSRGAQKRAARGSQVIAAGSANVATFQSKEIAPWSEDEVVEQAANASARLEALVDPPRLDAERDLELAPIRSGDDGPQQQAGVDAPPAPDPAVSDPVPAAAPVTVRPHATEPHTLDVAVSPLAAQRIDDQHLALIRTVRVGEANHLQGVVLSLHELARHLEREILGGPLAPSVVLRWTLDGQHLGASHPADYRFDHAFAEPFTALGATASVGAIGDGPTGERTLFQLATLLAVVTLVGLVVVHRSVAVVVDFARRRNDFVAAVSHELKTPLTSIRLYAEMLRDGMVPDGSRRTYYATMASEGERLSRLIGNVLELSRLERDDRPVVLEAGRPGEVIADLLRILGPHARAEGVTLSIDIDEDLPPALYDHDALLQVLVNLVDNAIKFGKGAEPAEVVVHCARSDDAMVLQVRDHGPGVPERQLRHIFAPFFRGERELTRTTKGTGIGLALVSGLVRRMNSEVFAANHPEGGLLVEVRLPLAV